MPLRRLPVAVADSRGVDFSVMVDPAFLDAEVERIGPICAGTSAADGAVN